MYEMTTEQAFFHDAGIELGAAVKKFGWQQDLTLADHLTVLVEEVGEVAREINERNLGNPFSRDRLRAELTQVAAMAAKMAVAVAALDTEAEAKL